MITIIRKHIKSTLFKALMWVFILILGAVFLMPDTMSNRMQSAPWIVRVNAQEIDGLMFSKAIAKHEYNVRMLRQQYGQYADMFMQMLGIDQDPKKVALQELIREELVNQVVDKIPLYLEKDYIDQKFNDFDFVQSSGLYTILPLGFFNAQGIDEQALRSYLLKMGITGAQFETMVEKAIARYIALELAGLASYTPSYMIQEAIKNNLGKKNFGLFTFSLESLKDAERKKGLSEDDVRAFFEKHNKNKRYWLAEQRAGTVWVFDPADYGTSVSSDQIKQYYEAQKQKKYVSAPSQVQVRRILFKNLEGESQDQAMQRAQQVRTALEQKPNDFARIAKEVSQDASSASNGGLIPFFSKGQRDQTFERKSFLLKNEGDISEVFQSADGIELVQLVAKKPLEYTPLEKVEGDIKKTLLQQAFVKDFAKDLKPILDASGLNEKALDVFIQNKKHTKNNQLLAGKDDSKLMTTLFRLKKGEADFYIDGNVGYIVQLTDIKPKSAPDLSAVRAQVESDLLQERAEKSLQDHFVAIKASLKEGDAQKIAKEHGAEFSYSGLINKDDKDAIKKLKDAHAPIDKMLQIGKKGAAGTSVDDKYAYLFFVADTQSVQQDTEKEKLMTVIARTNYDRKTLFIEGFVASLSENATIETNNSILNLSETH